MLSLSERLRYVLLRGKLVKEGDEWVYYSFPGEDLVVMRDKSKWVIVEMIYDLRKGIRI
jgi:hypothetical protein